MAQMGPARFGRTLVCFSPTLSSRLMFAQRREFNSEIFVSRLSYYTTDEEFRGVFSRFGDVKDARLILDGKTQRPKGFGFVSFASEAEAQSAVKAMDGTILRGRLIFVEIAKPRQEKTNFCGNCEA